jgi:hypothetical protein
MCEGGLKRPPGEPWEVSPDELREAVASMPEGLRTKAGKVAYVRRRATAPDAPDPALTPHEMVVETFLWAGWEADDDGTLRRPSS